MSIASSINNPKVTPTPFMQNTLTQPDAPSLPMHDAVNTASGELSSTASSPDHHTVQTPVITTRENSKATTFESMPRAIIQGNADAQGNLSVISGRECDAKTHYAKAVKCFRLAEEQQLARAQGKPVESRGCGDPVERNYAKAVKHYHLAADLGHISSQHNLGIIYATGQGVAQNHANAFKYFQLAAERGNFKAQYNLGVAYEYGRGVEPNHAEAFRCYRLAADQGHVAAQYNLGLAYEYGRGVESNHVEAFRCYQLAADQGHVVAQLNVGEMYNNGCGVAQSAHDAVGYYKLAADQGNALAQYSLGFLHHYGNGVERSFEKAIEYYRLAADQGDVESMVSLGTMYEKGCGVAVHHANAIQYYQLAAAQGHALAQYNLGVMHQKGAGVVRNYVKAAEYYELAAEQGDNEAQRKLGELYRDGKGVLPDAEKAMRCFWKANRSTNVIDFSHAGITDEMMQHLPGLFEEFGAYIQTNERLGVTDLDLSMNSMTDNSAPFIALILRHTRTLTELSIEYCGITDHGMTHILDALKNYNTSVVDFAFYGLSTTNKETLDTLIEQNRTINKILGGLETCYPMEVPKAFDILPMDISRQLLSTIAVVHAKNPPPSNIISLIASLIFPKPATTRQAVDEAYNFFMSDPASTSRNAGIKQKHS